MKKRSEFVPGWRMTADQKDLYFALLAKAGRVNQWVKEELEEQRQRAHTRAFGFVKSRKEIDHLKEFDAIKAELQALANPSDMNGVVKTMRQPRRRLETKIMIEQMKQLAVVESESLKEESAEFYAVCPERAGAHNFEPDFERAYAYVQTLLQERFHARDLSEVSDEPRMRFYQWGPKKGQPTGVELSDLECVRDTLDARINERRCARVAAQAGMSKAAFDKLSTGAQQRYSRESTWTIHDLKTAAGVECDCATHCRGKSAAVKEEELEAKV